MTRRRRSKDSRRRRRSSRRRDGSRRRSRQKRTWPRGSRFRATSSATPPLFGSPLPKRLKRDNESIDKLPQEHFIARLYGQDMVHVAAQTQEFFQDKKWNLSAVVLLQQLEEKDYVVDETSVHVDRNITDPSFTTVILISIKNVDEPLQSHAVTVTQKNRTFWIFDSLGKHYAQDTYGPKLVEWVKTKIKRFVVNDPSVEFIPLPMHNIEYMIDSTRVQMCWPLAMYATSVLQTVTSIDESFEKAYFKNQVRRVQGSDRVYVADCKKLIKEHVLPLFDPSSQSATEKDELLSPVSKLDLSTP